MLTCVLLLSTLAAAGVPPPIVLPPLDGVPVKLAWSKDGQTLYVASAANTKRDAPLVKQFLVALADPQPRPTADTPDWVADYWTWKSDRTSEHWPGLTIDVKTAKKKVGPNGGAPTRDALTGGTMSDAAGAGAVDTATRSEQNVLVFTLLLKGRTISETEDPPTPGLTFGWVPGGDGPIMVYVNERGRVAVMDGKGHSTEIKDTDKATLPAVSWDGKRLAYLCQTGRHEWSAYVRDLQP